MIDIQIVWNFLSLYANAVWKAISNPWFEYVKNDSTSGNGFQIIGYGIQLMFTYFCLFMLRLIIFILFPISGLLIMFIDHENDKYNKKKDDKYKNDPNFDI